MPPYFKIDDLQQSETCRFPTGYNQASNCLRPIKIRIYLHGHHKWQIREYPASILENGSHKQTDRADSQRYPHIFTDGRNRSHTEEQRKEHGKRKSHALPDLCRKDAVCRKPLPSAEPKSCTSQYKRPGCQNQQHTAFSEKQTLRTLWKGIHALHGIVCKFCMVHNTCADNKEKRQQHRHELPVGSH